MPELLVIGRLASTDPGVGLTEVLQIGTAVAAGEALALVHARTHGTGGPRPPRSPPPRASARPLRHAP